MKPNSQISNNQTVLFQDGVKITVFFKNCHKLTGQLVWDVKKNDKGVVKRAKHFGNAPTIQEVKQLTFL